MSYRPHAVLLPGKHPAEEIDVGLPLSRWLMEGETLASWDLDWEPGIVLTPQGRPAPSVSDASLFVFWLGGGTSGATYQGELGFRTSEGRYLVVSMLIEVIDPTPAVPAS